MVRSYEASEKEPAAGDLKLELLAQGGEHGKGGGDAPRAAC